MAFKRSAVRSRLSPPPVNPPWNCVPGLFHFLGAIIQEVDGLNVGSIADKKGPRSSEYEPDIFIGLYSCWSVHALPKVALTPDI